MMTSMKKSNSNVYAEEDLLQNSSWEETPLISWLVHYGRYLLLGISLVAALILIAYQIQRTSVQKAERNYIAAEREFNQFKNLSLQQESGQISASLETLAEILQQHPELQTKYDGQIAQILIASENPEAAIPFAYRTQARTFTENAPFYSEYAENSLLIASKQYTQALENAQSLNKRMGEKVQTASASRDFEQTLLFFNLLRIAALQRQLGLTVQEGETWREWKDLIKKGNFKKELALFQVGQFSLQKYVDARESLKS
jgi:hypothetical protein